MIKFLYICTYIIVYAKVIQTFTAKDTESFNQSITKPPIKKN